MYNKERLFAVLVVLIQLAGCSATSSLPQTPSEPISAIELRNDSTAVEGFWLGPQLAGSVHDNMQTNGLNISAREIYHLDNSALNHALVRITNGQNHAGSGAFVSREGLILASYNTISQTLSSLKTLAREFENGFFTQTSSGEIPLPNYELHIPIEQYEVTQQINRFLSDTLTYRERQQWKQQIQQQLLTSRKQGNEDIGVQINNFWSGNRQFLTVYKIIRDVRLVHLPPESIALWGGNKAHWQWPQFRGHYAFLRAYVDPKTQGGSAFKQTNIPFEPDRFLTVNSKKVQSGDFTLFMGFPRKTYRQESSYAFNFYKNVLNPVLLKSNQAIFNSLEHTAQEDSLQTTLTKASRTNMSRNIGFYKYVQRQFDQRNVIEKKRIFEQKLSQWITNDSLRKQKYGRVLSQLKQAYDIAAQTGDLLYAIVYPLNNTKLMQIANLYDSYLKDISDSNPTTALQAEKDSLIKMHQRILSSMDIDVQNMMLTDMLHTLASLPDGKVLIHLIHLFGDNHDQLRDNIRSFLEQQREKSIIYNIELAREYLSQPADTLRLQPPDPMITLYQKLIENYQISRNNFTQHIRYLEPAQERYVSAISAFKAKQFNYPEGNLTMRLNGGKIQGFISRDGTSHKPLVTISDLIEATGNSGSSLPYHLASSDADSSITVSFLSSNDISYNNSGNIILNNDGELIGLTIDRNSEGITSDYMYDPKHARSINLSTSYIIYLMKNIFNTDRLLKEIDYR